MKKRINILLIFFNISLCFAEKYVFEDIIFQEYYDSSICFNSGIFIKQTEENRIEKFKYQIKQKGAYLTAEIFYNETPFDVYIFNADEKHIILFDTYTNKEFKGTNKNYNIAESQIMSCLDFDASSFLTETLQEQEVSYKPENLGKSIKTSWVEGVKGDGIGEKVSFTNVLENYGGVKRIYIINGFFSEEKPSLFFDNGRVKKINIRCFDINEKLVNTIEAELEDTGKMQFIDFSEKYSKFELEILSVYPGRKYHDTAITGIYFDCLSAY